MAYISASEVKAIREALKVRFPEYKFSVRKSSGGHAVEVDIMKGKDDFLKDIGECYEGAGYTSINHYHTHMYGDYKVLFDKIVDTIHYAPGGQQYYDNSDAMVDYFDTAFYVNLGIGRYGKPYMMEA